ncbi:unnamed protein product [Closterium sp. NIES-54]
MFQLWLAGLHRYLRHFIRDGVSLFEHTPGSLQAPTTPTEPVADAGEAVQRRYRADCVARTQWMERDAVAELTVRDHLPVDRRTHFVDPPGSILWMGPPVASDAVLPIARLGRTPFSCCRAIMARGNFSSRRTLGARGDFLPVALPCRARDALPARRAPRGARRCPARRAPRVIVRQLIMGWRVCAASPAPPPPPSPTAAAAAEGGGCVGDEGVVLRGWCCWWTRRFWGWTAAAAAPPETLSPQQLREWAVWWGSPGGGAWGTSAGGVEAPSGVEATSLGACEPASTVAEPEEALHSFILDLGASCCFFRDCTTVTPLTTLVPVTLADPSCGPVVARGSTVLPCPAAPSGSLTGLHLSSFAKNLVATAVVHDQFVTATQSGGELVAICTDSRTGEHLAKFTRRTGSGLYMLATKSAQVAESGQVDASVEVAASCLSRLLTHQNLLWHHRLGHPSLPRQRGMHSHLLSKADVRSVLIRWIRAVRRQLSARFQQDLPVLRLHSDRGGEFSSRLLEDFYGVVGITQLFMFLASPQQNGIAERHIGSVMEQLNLWPRVSHLEPSPTLWWRGEVGDASAFCVWGSLALVCILPTGKLSPLTLCCVFLGFPTDAPSWQFYHSGSRRVLSSQDVTFGESIGFYRLHPHRRSFVALRLSSWGMTQHADDTATTRHSQRLVTSPGFPPRPSSPPLQPVTVDSGAAGGGDTGGVDSGGAACPTGGQVVGTPAGDSGSGSGSAGAGGAKAGGVGAGGAGAEGTGVGGAGGTGAGGAGLGGAGAKGTGARRQETLSPQRLRKWAVRRGSPSGGAGGAGAGVLVLLELEVLVLDVLVLELVVLPDLLLEVLGSDLVRAASPTVTRFMATVVTDPTYFSPAASALVAELIDIAATCRLDYAASLVSDSDPPVGGGLALGCDVLEDRQVELECLAATIPHLAAMLLCPEEDPDALDIPTPHSYAEAISGPSAPPLGPLATAAATAATAPAAIAAPESCAAMASLRVLAFDHEGRPVAFETWHDNLQLYLLSDSKDSVSLFDHVSGVAPIPPATADGLTRSRRLSHDATARLAIRNHLPVAKCTHFGQHWTAQALYDAVVARYSSPATAALGRQLLPYLFPELSAFATLADLSLASLTLFALLGDHFLSLDPTSLTVDLLEQHLLVAETSAVAVGAARGTPHSPFFEGCSPSPLSPSFASAAAADVSVTEDVGAASTSAKRHSSKGKGGRGGGGGSGGGGGGSGSGGGGSGGGGGGNGGGGSGGTGGGIGGSGGSGGNGGGGTGGGRSGPRRGGPGGGQRQQQQRRSETQSPQ